MLEVVFIAILLESEIALDRLCLVINKKSGQRPLFR